MKILLVGVGGFAGSVARYLIGGYVQDLSRGTFPFGTLAVNALGCLVIGGLSELSEARGFLTPEARALLARDAAELFGAAGGNAPTQ